MAPRFHTLPRLAKFLSNHVAIDRSNRRGTSGRTRIGPETSHVLLLPELSQLLQEAGIPHEVLNVKPENVEREAEIVAQSGHLGAVTIATNMTGRGTDIMLGGNAEFIARLKLREILMPMYHVYSVLRCN